MEAATARPASGLNRGDAIGAASAMLLLVLMFALEWYGVDGIPGRGSPRTGVVSAEDAWHGLTVVRWELLLTVVVALGSVAIHARAPSRAAVAGARLAVATLGTLTAVLLVVRVLIDLPAPTEVADQKLGAVLGLLAGLGIAFGGYESIRVQRVALIQTSTSADRLASGRVER